VTSDKKGRQLLRRK